LILIAVLSLTFSLCIPRLSYVNAQPPVLQSQAAIALLQKGRQYYDAGQFAQATTTLQQVAKLAQAAGDTLQQAQALSFTSLAQQKLGQWPEAESAINTSLSLLQDLPPNQDVNQVYAQALNTQAHLQLGKGNTEQALETWQAAEKLYNKVGDRNGIIGSQMNQALALQGLGLYRRAEKTLTAVEQLIYQQPDSLLKAVGLLNLGNFLRQQKHLKRSQEVIQKSLEIAEKLDLPQAKSKALLSLGNTELALSRRSNHQTYIQEALNHYQQAAQTTASPITKIQAQLNQLGVFLQKKQSSEIAQILPQINGNLKYIPLSRDAIYAQVNFAQKLIKLDNKNKSLLSSIDINQILNNAINQSKSLTDQRAESYSLGTLGELYEKQLDWSNATQMTKSALVLAQAINAPDITYQWQWQMGRILQSQAEQKLHNHHAHPEAINYYNQAFNTLNTLRSDLVALNPEIQYSFRESVETLYRQLVDLLLRSPNPSREYLIQARNVMEALQLAELDNFFGDACAQPQAVNIDSLDPNAAVIYPIILPDRLEVVIKLPGTDNLRHYSNQNVSNTQVDAVVTQLRQSLIRRSTSLSKIKKDTQQIYDWIIRPFETELETTINREQSQIKNLVFVLDGSLRNVPMAALYDGKRYLIERYAVNITSGLQLLEPKPLKRESLSVLVGGATNAPSFVQEGLGKIDNVKVELTGIQEQVKSSLILDNQQFLKENIRQKINSQPFNVIHLATHGRFSSNLEDTFILDWQKRIQVNDLDNLLELNYQRNSKPIELLILSACETATGDKRAALGLAGVAIKAGARSTLATLWQVNDASTAEFMIKFYQELNKPQITKSEALRNVQLAFMKDFPSTDFYRPYHWASFILVGNWL
jgi:CHAT domain-containing protein/DNA-directed RNA polymerase subunit F